ncbi:MAG TPA: GMC oxidoreductase [Candidatus Krumholzibacteria bacterium]|nr:GMC oxidoreductase [Candidatus Krumholzibacteria bacterium]
MPPERQDVDFIVVGSGMAGVHAAQTLVDAGARVLMLDGGATAQPATEPPAGKSFVALRQNDREQHRYFLGDRLEAIATPAGRPGSQLTPTRRFIVDHVDRWLRFHSDSFAPMESLALGGLGNAWGAGCYHFSDRDLEDAGLPAAEIRSGYQLIADRIGVQGEDDDTSAFCGGPIQRLQPVMDMDAAASALYARYRSRRQAMLARGLHMGRPALAVLTRPMPGREPVAFHNMDFYADNERTAYRPWCTLDVLRRNPLFEYRGDVVVTDFVESADRVTVSGRSASGSDPRALQFAGRSLVLCSGAIGTMRIVARSLNGMDRAFPILTNPCDYLLGIQPARIGKSLGERLSSFAQLALFYRPRGEEHPVFSGGSVYTYQALMLFRLAREAPLSFALSRDLLQFLQTSLLMIGMTYPDWPTRDNFLKLTPDRDSPTGDTLTAAYRMSERQEMMRTRTLGAIRRHLPGIGCWIASAVRGKNGFSSHYAGTVPYSPDERPFALAPNGRLYGTGRVYVADSAGFRFLPALGLTWTIMANAHRVARGLVAPR